MEHCVSSGRTHHAGRGTTRTIRVIRNGVLDPQPLWQAPPVTGQGANELNWSRCIRDSREPAGVHLVSEVRRTREHAGRGARPSRRRDAHRREGNLRRRRVGDRRQPGRSILFGPDGTLYVTVGDRDRLCCIGNDDNSLRMKAQDLDNHVGKTLRLRDDGSVPPDNPFVGRAGAKPEIFTYGHRNGYGLAFHPETGELWQAEIGPLGGDEVNILLPGHNYGWPLVSMGRNYTGTLVSDEPWFRAGMDNPRMFWVPSISPSSLMFYTGDKFPHWKDNLFVGALNGQSAAARRRSTSRRRPSGASRCCAPLEHPHPRRAAGSDGYIYVATELGSGGNTPDGTVLRIEPITSP